MSERKGARQAFYEIVQPTPDHPFQKMMAVGGPSDILCQSSISDLYDWPEPLHVVFGGALIAGEFMCTGLVQKACMQHPR